MNNDLHAKLEVFRIAFASSICVLAMGEGSGADDEHKRGNPSREQVRGFKFSTADPAAGHGVDVRWKAFLESVQTPVHGAHIYTLSQKGDLLGRDRAIDRFCAGEAFTKLTRGGALFKINRLKAEHQHELDTRTSAEGEDGREAQKQKLAHAQQIKELKEGEPLSQQTKAAEAGTSAVLDKLASLLKPAKDEPTRSLRVGHAAPLPGGSAAMPEYGRVLRQFVSLAPDDMQDVFGRRHEKL